MDGAGEDAPASILDTEHDPLHGRHGAGGARDTALPGQHREGERGDPIAARARSARASGMSARAATTRAPERSAMNSAASRHAKRSPPLTRIWSPPAKRAQRGAGLRRRLRDERETVRSGPQEARAGRARRVPERLRLPHGEREAPLPLPSPSKGVAPLPRGTFGGAERCGARRAADIAARSRGLGAVRNRRPDRPAAGMRERTAVGAPSRACRIGRARRAAGPCWRETASRSRGRVSGRSSPAPSDGRAGGRPAAGSHRSTRRPGPSGVHASRGLLGDGARAPGPAFRGSSVSLAASGTRTARSFRRPHPGRPSGVRRPFHPRTGWWARRLLARLSPRRWPSRRRRPVSVPVRPPFVPATAPERRGAGRERPEGAREPGGRWREKLFRRVRRAEGEGDAAPAGPAQRAESGGAGSSSRKRPVAGPACGHRSRRGFGCCLRKAPRRPERKAGGKKGGRPEPPAFRMHAFAGPPGGPDPRRALFA
ncbi:MAG: hypothetical protein D6718_08100 [Acidobacteria bacterium]|nr:MAG: hypothetical protein D6718_08100 [Acidobacteriota bacterium]